MNDIDFFYGFEVENTPAKGLGTVWIVGLPTDCYGVTAVAHGYSQLRMGANNSFNPTSTAEWERWEEVLLYALDNGVEWVSLEFGIEHYNRVLESCVIEYPNFIPILKIDMPYINQLGYNAVLKIGDTKEKTNPGNWTVYVQELISRKAYTHHTHYPQESE